MKSFLRDITPALVWRAASAAKRRVMGQRKLSYAGNGEDLIILGWLQTYGCDLSRIRYVDVGANHPTFLSNTYLLYEAGARGILIEPNPDLATLLRAKRPRDVVVNAGIAFDARRTATLFRLTSPGFNTFSRAQAEHAVEISRGWAPVDRQEIIDQIDVPLIPLNEVVREHMSGDAPHVISIDAEGVDLPILKTLDLGLLNSDLSIPTLICIEASTGASDFLEILAPSGFQLTARTPDNWIFRRHRQRLRLLPGE